MENRIDSRFIESPLPKARINNCLSHSKPLRLDPSQVAASLFLPERLGDVFQIKRLILHVVPPVFEAHSNSMLLAS